MRILKWLCFLALSAVPPFAGFDASVTITYTPVSGTPALSETMLIALGLLLPVLAFRSLRSMKGGGTFAAILAAGSLIALEAITGVHMIPEGKAIVAGPLLSSPTGGTTSSFSVSRNNTYPATNNSGVTLVIQSVNWSLFASGALVVTGAGYCTNGMSLANSASCNLGITVSSPGL